MIAPPVKRVVVYARAGGPEYRATFAGPMLQSIETRPLGGGGAWLPLLRTDVGLPEVIELAEEAYMAMQAEDEGR